MTYLHWTILLCALLTVSACRKPAENAREDGPTRHKAGDEHGHAHDEKEAAHQEKQEEHASKDEHHEQGEPAGSEHREGDAHAGEHKEGAARGELVLDEDALRDLRISTAVAQKRPEQVPVSALGELRVDETRYAEVGAAVPGRVVRLIASEGDTVKKGQTLADLESPEVGQARAALLQATARHSLAKRALERKKSLLEGGTVSQRELEETETELTTAEAELKAARATLSPMGVTEKGDGGRFSLVSPLAGQVLSRDLHLGELVSPEKRAYRVADLSHLWVVASVFERDAVHLSTGAPAHVLPASLPGQRLEAKVARVGAEVQSESRTVQVRLELDNPGGQLKPGMSANVQFLNVVGSTPAVVTVPLASVQRIEDRWVVFVPKGKGRFEVRTIGRGRDLGGEVEVRSGLEAGTEIVVEGSFVLRASATQGKGDDDHHHH